MAVVATALDIPTAEGMLNAHLYAPAAAPERAPEESAEIKKNFFAQMKQMLQPEET